MAEKGRVYRCAGCGEWLDSEDVDGDGHTITCYDSDGYPYPELCGPCYPWEEEEKTVAQEEEQKDE